MQENTEVQLMGGLLEYSGLVAKSRAMRGRLLTREDFERITEFKTVQEVISFLREQESYGKVYGGREEIQHRGQVEELIYHSVKEDYRKLCRFGDESQRRAMKLYLEQLALKEAPSEADIPYFVRAWEEIGDFSGKKMRRVLREIFGTQIDWLNIMWIYRAKYFFHQEPRDIEGMLIPVCYKLRRKERQALMESRQAEEFQQILQGTSYYRGREALVKVQDEVSYRYVMRKMYRQICRKYPFSIAPVFYYLYEKELEAQYLTTAIEGVRYQIPSKDIREMILLHTSV